MAEQRKVMLSELAELSMSLARKLHGQAMAAEGQAQADLALAFQRVSRSLRQTLALQDKLERDRRLAERQAAEDAARETRARIHRRERQVRNALSPLVWDEAEGDEDEADPRLDRLHDLITEAAEQDDFLSLPLETCIARIRADLRLSADGPGPIAPAPPTVTIWRSSA